MKILKTISILALMIATVSCGSVKVAVDTKDTTDFSKYKTYSFQGWQNNSDEILSDEDRKLMRDAFIKEFESRGLTKVNTKGDMQISLYIVMNKKTAFSGYNDYVGGYNNYAGIGGSYSYGYSNNTYKQRDKLVGTLIMNVYDSQSNNRIWQAVATSTATKNPEKRKKTIPGKITSLMKRFPVQPK